jgi:hypothetical protein
VVTRRALLGAGVLVLAGCGPPDEPEVVPKDVLEQQLRVAVTAAQALNDTPKLRDSADVRVLRIAAAYERLGGVWEDVASAAPANPDALAAVRAELAAHVQAVGLLGATEYRELFAEVVASAAADEAALAPVRELTAFPGTP